MKFISRMVLAVAIAVAGASIASAQGRPGAGGAAGFGFGMGGATSAHAILSTNKVLQEEIKVTEEQKTKLEEAMKPITAKRNELFGNTAQGGQRGQRGQGGQGGQRPMITEEQRKEREEKLAKITAETKKAVEGVLESKQAKRLNEINYQMMGFAAFTNKDVQEALKVTDAQKEKLKSISEEYTKDSAELRRDAPRGAGFGGGRPGGQQPSDEDRQKIEEYNKKRDALRKEAEDKAAAVLDDTQKKAWKELLGEKFDTTKLAAGFQRPMRRDN